MEESTDSNQAWPPPSRAAAAGRRWLALGLVVLMYGGGGGGGCASIRVTDPPRTATEQFLMSQACKQVIEQFSTDTLRDRKVYVDSAFLTAAVQTSAEDLFVLGELRSKLLTSGVRLVPRRDDADIVLEVRSGAIGIDRTDFLLGIPALYFSSAVGGGTGQTNLPISTPEIALLKSTKQHGYAQLAYVAYWRDTGEVVTSSGPYVGRTLREDYWILGTGPRTVGNIPPVEGPRAGPATRP